MNDSESVSNGENQRRSSLRIIRIVGALIILTVIGAAAWAFAEIKSGLDRFHELREIEARQSPDSGYDVHFYYVSASPAWRAVAGIALGLGIVTFGFPAWVLGLLARKKR